MFIKENILRPLLIQLIKVNKYLSKQFSTISTDLVTKLFHTTFNVNLSPIVIVYFLKIILCKVFKVSS